MSNFSFEETKDGIPTGWRWSKRNTDAVLFVDEKVAHTGRRSVLLRNTTPFGAHVYGTFWTEPGIKVKPATQYVLSFYARSDSPGAAWVGGGQGWRIRKRISPTGGKWRRFSIVFTTGGNETEFVLRINTDSPTPGFWVDDMKLEEGDRPTLCEPPPGCKDIILMPPEWHSAMPNGPWESVFEVFAPLKRAVYVTALLTQGEKSVEKKKSTQLSPGVSKIRVKGVAEKASDELCHLSVRITDRVATEVALAEASTGLRFLSAANAQQRVSSLTAQANKLKQMISTVRQMGMDPAYPLVGVTTVSDFIQYVRADLEHGELERAFDELNDLESIADRTEKQLDATISGQEELLEMAG